MKKYLLIIVIVAIALYFVLSDTNNLPDNFVEKTYTNDSFSFSFKHPEEWSLSELNDISGSGYDKTRPFLSVWTGEVDDGSCEGIGCPPEPGNRIELAKGDTSQGDFPFNPWYELIKVEGNRWVSIQLKDTLVDCTTADQCENILEQTSLEERKIVEGPDYERYNDFLHLIDTLEFAQ